MKWFKRNPKIPDFVCPFCQEEFFFGGYGYGSYGFLITHNHRIHCRARQAFYRAAMVTAAVDAAWERNR